MKIIYLLDDIQIVRFKLETDTEFMHMGLLHKGAYERIICHSVCLGER